MTYEGREINTFGDVSREVEAIVKAEDRDAAERFLAAYQAENPHAAENIGYLSGYFSAEMMARIHAAENIGYLSGYFSAEMMARIQDLFGVAHPIFGRSRPTPEEAFEAGKRHGRSAK
jgi:hypothetical protein